MLKNDDFLLLINSKERYKAALMSAMQAFGSPEKTVSIPAAYNVHINQTIRVCKKKYFTTAPKDITNDHKVWSYTNFMQCFLP